MQKSTNILSKINILYLLFLLLLFSPGAKAESDCTGKPFPSKITMKDNENLIINLQSYFVGTNLSFTVSPNNTQSMVQQNFRCQTLGSQRLGKIIASRYSVIQEKEIITAITSSVYSEGVFSFLFIELNGFKITILNMPSDQISECSDFAVEFINSTHFAPTIDCKSNNKLFQRFIFTTVGEIGSPYADWRIIEADLFVYTQVSVRLQIHNHILIRGVLSHSNSYIELWTWENEIKELVYLYDKVFLGLDIFNVKQMQLYGDMLALLQYNTGLYLFNIRITKSLQLRDTFSQSFYEQFQYNPLTGILYLGKKGKIVSTSVDYQTSSFGTIATSFNVYKYQNVRKILTTNNGIIVLGDTMLNLFRIGKISQQNRHSQIYQSDKTQNIFKRQSTKGLQIMILKNIYPNLQLLSCRSKFPYLKLATPSESSTTITVTAISMLNGQRTNCYKNILIQKVRQDKDIIYDNGYSVGKEILYANTPGSGIIELSKYGIGRNIKYSVVPYNRSKIQYSAIIRKSQNINCSFENKPIQKGGKINFLRSWENMVISQFTYDNALRYNLCIKQSNISCKYKADFFRLGKINYMTFETVVKTNQETTILQAFLLENINYVVIVRKISINNKKGDLTFDSYCNITFYNAAENFFNISQLEIVNKRLFIVMPYRKEIHIYDLSNQVCQKLVTIDKTNSPWKYFAPRSIHFDHNQGLLRQQSFIITQWNEIYQVILDKTNSGIRTRLLSMNTVQSMNQYALFFSSPYLVTLDCSTNKGYIYYADENENLKFLKTFGEENKTYNTKQCRGFAQFLDSKHLSINLYDKNKNAYSVQIYKIDELISSAMQYLIIPLKYQAKQTWLFIDNERYAIKSQLVQDATSSYSQLTCNGNETYLSPSLLLKFNQSKTSLEEYSQNVSLILYTDKDSAKNSFKIVLSNVGNLIRRGRTFPPRGSSVNAQKEIIIDDSYWFSGSTMYYEFDCQDCQDRIEFKPKITRQIRQNISIPMNNFWLQSNTSNLNVLIGHFALKFNYNHSINPSQYFDYNKTSVYEESSSTQLTIGNGNCIKGFFLNKQHQIVALCWRLTNSKKEYYLSLVSTSSFKGFVVQEYGLTFEDDFQPNIIIKNDVIFAYSSKIAVVLAIWMVEDELKFIQLDQIDRDDIENNICSFEVLTNATSASNKINGVFYSLVITQCNSQIYFNTFDIILEKQEYFDEKGNTYYISIPNVHVRSAQNINLMRILTENNIQTPGQAKIIKTIGQSRESGNQYIFSIFVIFDKFHTYELLLRLSDKGDFLGLTLSSVFYKYGIYIGISAEVSEYLVIKNIVDFGTGRLQQLYSFYDLKQYTMSSAGIKQYQIFSIYALTSFFDHQGEEQIPWHLKGHEIIQFNNKHLQMLNITNLIRAHIKNYNPDDPNDKNATLYSQDILIIANNINSARSATIVLKAVDRIQLTTWQIVLIVVASLVTIVLSIFLGNYGFKKYKKAKKMVPLIQTFEAEDAELQVDEKQRMERYNINDSLRGSAQPSQI